MTEFITLKEVLSQMDAGRSFSISFITCDKKMNSAGELVDIAEARKNNWLNESSVDTLTQNKPDRCFVTRDPNHYSNSTRNILMPGGQIRKVHIRLIRKFNGQTVL